MIPENVIEVLVNIQQSGAINMRDRLGVIEIADVMDEGAADWLRDNQRLYGEALNVMGARVSGGNEE